MHFLPTRIFRWELQIQQMSIAAPSQLLQNPKQEEAGFYPVPSVITFLTIKLILLKSSFVLPYNLMDFP